MISLGFFGNLAMINVGRAIAYAQNPAFEAKKIPRRVQ